MKHSILNKVIGPRRITLLGFICSAIFLIGQEQFTGYGTESFAQGLFEYQGHYYLSFWDEQETDSIFVHQFYKLDESLNRVDSLEYSAAELLGESSILSGRFSDANGSLEFVGIGAYKHELGTFNTPEDSTFFVRLLFDQNFDITASEKKFLRNGFYVLTDLILKDGMYMYSARDGLIGYWVGRISTSLQESYQSEVRLLDPGSIPTFNPYLLTKIVIMPEYEGLHLRTDAVHMDFYNEQLEFDSVYSIPMVDFGIPSYGWMSQGYADLENSYFVGSSSSNSSYVLQLSRPGEFINEFAFYYQDTLVTNSLYRVLSMDSEKNLYMGMHIRDENEEYFSHMKVIKCDTMGNMIWQSTFGEAGNIEYVHREIVCTSDGGVLMMADRYSDPEADDPDGVILYKLNDQGAIVGVASFDVPTSTFEFYPNPAMDVVYLSDELNGAKFIIVNMMGQEVIEGEVEGASIDTSWLESGEYILSIYSEDEVVSRIFQISR